MLLSLTYKKWILSLLAGISLFFFTGSVFAQVFDGEEETQSWVINMWSPTNEETPTTNETPLSWDVGSALGIESSESTSTQASHNSSGSGSGGRLGTANYSLRNRSTLVTMERQAMVAQQQQQKPEFDPTYTIVDLPKADAHNTIVKDNSESPIEIVDHVLIAAAGQDDLVTPYQEPKPIRQTQTQTQQPKKTSLGSQVIRSSAPKQTSLAQNFTSKTGSILVKSETFPIHQTHLLSWEGVQEDITSYKQNVIKKIILNVLVITGKGLFYISIIGILLFLLFREKLTIFHRNKVRQLTLFSLLK